MHLTQGSSQSSLRRLFWIFLKIGSTAWGGSMSLVAVVQNYIRKNNLLEEQDMLDAIFLASVLPGAMSFNVVVGVGYRLRGLKGALICGLGVILPTLVLVLSFSFAYFQWGQIPAVNKLFMGFTPAMSAIIISAAWSMGRKTIKGIPELVISLAACSILLGVGGFYSTVGIVLGSGFAGWFLFGRSNSTSLEVPKQIVPFKSDIKDSGNLLSVSLLPAMWFMTVQPSLILKLFTTFSAMSITLFGGGYVFIPIIQDVVVNNYGWVTTKEFMDSIAISQVTPGPILISSAFIGYKVAGFWGGLSATLGMFLPSALLMIAGTSFLDMIKKSSVIKAALQGIRISVVGMLIAAAFIVASTAPHHWGSAVILVASLIAILRFRVEVALIIPIAGLASFALY